MNRETLQQNTEQFLEQRQKHANALVRLWTSSVPSAHLPTADNFFGWVDTFGLEVAAAGIQRTSAKARKCEREHCPMDGADLERYATGTMKSLGREAGFTRR
jgi:hypothetical protein